MASKLPYLSSPGTIDNALERVKTAATPPTFNNDFVHTKLQIKGGTGKAIPPFFKKIGLVSESGTPTALYHGLRNPATAGAAIAAAMRTGYRPLFEANEYCYSLASKDLMGLILQVTGFEKGTRSAELIHSTYLRLKKHADFEASLASEESSNGSVEPSEHISRTAARDLDMRIGYTINLNLPPSTNIEVFNAIFQSLRRNLLADE